MVVPSHLSVASTTAKSVLELIRLTLGVLAIDKPQTHQDKVWFEDFCRSYLEMMGWILLSISSHDVELVIREVLTACTYKFPLGGLQFLCPTRVTSPFLIFKIQNALR